MALLLILLLQDDGWNSEWKFRRKIVVQNRADAPLAAGHQIGLEFDPGYLGLTKKCAADYRDIVLVHGGKEHACWVRPGRSKPLAVWFRTAAEIPKDSRDTYLLYYGHPTGGRRVSESSVFEFAEEFSSGSATQLDADPDIAMAVRDGRLVISDASADRTDLSPSLLRLKAGSIPPSFSLTVDLEIAAAGDAVFETGLRVDFHEKIEVTAAVRKRIDDLAEKLGAFDWEEREEATRELLKIGTPAIPRLEQSLRSSDPEVKWRAEHVLKELRESASWPVVFAGIRLGDPELRPSALVWRIGKTFQRQRFAGSTRITLTIERDPDGEVTVLWNGGRRSTGELKGQVKSLALYVRKGTANKLGEIRVDNILLRRCVDRDSQPTFTLETEETRK